MATSSLGSVDLTARALEGTSLPYSVSKHEWESHRATFERLYGDENKTLKEVMSIMERDYNLKAT